jgi:hypothetical protein
MTDSRFYLAPTIPRVTWFREVDPINIIGNLEYSNFVQNIFKKAVPAIDPQDTADFFSMSSSPKSFLNPVNLKAFFDNYMEQNYPPIFKRFNLAT